jgi:hypothetical protein
VQPPAAVRLTGGAGDVACRRAVLLQPYGEPVATPCGRCDRCAPSALGLPSGEG